MVLYTDSNIMNRWEEQRIKMMHDSGEWQTKTKRSDRNKRVEVTPQNYPTIDESNESQVPMRMDIFYNDYKNLAYSIGYDILSKKQVANFQDDLRDMLDYFMHTRTDYVNNLRLTYSSVQNHENILHIPKNKFQDEKKEIEVWAESLAKDLKQYSQQDKTSSSIKENSRTNVSYIKKKSASTPTGKGSTLRQHPVQEQAKKTEKMSWQDNLVEIGFPIFLIEEFYSFYPQMKHQSLAVVANAMFQFRLDYNSDKKEKSDDEFGSGLHGDMQYTGAYAAPACHALTYAAPVAYAGPHGMTYAAMAYDPVHAMTYAAPVYYGDARAMPSAAPAYHGGPGVPRRRVRRVSR